MIIRKKNNGFTLIELMVAVAIVGILAGIAYPSYINNLTKSRRVDAEGALLGLASAMERHFTENSNYLGAAGTSATPTDTGAPWIYSDRSPMSGTKYYDLTINYADGSSFTLKAAPTNAQNGDGCLLLTNTGLRVWDTNCNDTKDVGEVPWS
jgi:type IV pilus assembly protein PilE